jgi:hypothetical protein
MVIRRQKVKPARTDAEAAVFGEIVVIWRKKFFEKGISRCFLVRNVLENVDIVSASRYCCVAVSAQ